MSNHSEASGEAQAPDGASARSTRGTLRIAFVPGVTITKWSRIWEERRPDVALEFVPSTEADQLTVLHERRADISFVRHPIELGAVNAIRLYEELPVVVVGSEDPIADLPSVTLAELAGYPVHETPAMPMADAIALIAAGVGVVLVPHSVARLHSRKDVVTKQLTDAPATVISIAWLADVSLADESSADESSATASPTTTSPKAASLTDLIDEFVGIVRGRSANSSRSASVAGATPGASGGEASETQKAQPKTQPKAQPLSAKAQAKATARAKADAFARRARIQQDRRKPGR